MILIGLIKTIILGLPLVIAYELNAQPQALSVTYLDSSTEDEEGGKIFFPSFSKPFDIGICRTKAASRGGRV
jgi:hypothetical protein